MKVEVFKRKTAHACGKTMKTSVKHVWPFDVTKDPTINLVIKVFFRKFL